MKYLVITLAMSLSSSAFATCPGKCNLDSEPQKKISVISFTRIGDYLPKKADYTTEILKLKAETVEDLKINCAGELDVVKLDKKTINYSADSMIRLEIEAEAVCTENIKD